MGIENLDQHGWRGNNLTMLRSSASAPAATVQREDWMTKPMGRSLDTGVTDGVSEKEKKEQALKVRI